MASLRWLFLFWMVLYCLRWIDIPVAVIASPSKLPEASSTLLKMHRLYLQQPPHDTSLYDVLSVSPNATALEITKAYRRASRRLHPDKRWRRKHDNNDDDDESAALELVREAYEVLKDDSTRLPYHRYGLLDTAQAVLLLTGKGRAAADDPAFRELLHLMGYSDNAAKMGHWRRHRRREDHKHRVWFLAANLVEQIRPLVEGAIEEAVLADVIAEQCDRLKGLPLGAQILRCVGRAYRHEGRKVLRRHHAKKAPVVSIIPEIGIDLSDMMRDQWRHAKHVFTAAVASGRVVLSEQVSKRIQPKSQPPAISYHWDDLGELYDDEHADSSVPSDEEIKEQERRKAQDALLESLQLEALWKISKIELDRTVREACNLILEKDYFFFPSHQSKRPSDWDVHSNGWIGSTGIAVDAEIGRLRAAAALVMIGDILVQRSKEGTAWME